jgi:plastocyanin
VSRKRIVAVALPLLALALTACGSSSPPSGTASTASAAPTSGATATASPAVDQTIAITYAGGKVSGVPGRVDVKLGSTVALVVTSDVADEVHFHGYDKHAEVSAGGTATITFTASIPGVFEVELEKLGRRLVQLQIQ